MTDRRLHGRRVLFVIPSLGLGGAERQAFLLARHLASEEGAQVSLLGMSTGGGTADLCVEAGIPSRTFALWHRGRAAPWQLVDFLRFVILLRRERVEVLLPYCMFQNVLAGLAWKFGGVRSCVWSQRDEGRQRLRPMLERPAVRAMRAFISNSEHGAEFLRSGLGAAAGKVRVVRNGVELGRPGESRESWRVRLGLGPADFVACMMANLHRHKDHSTLVEAWRRVAGVLEGRGIGAHLLLAGSFADTYEDLRRQVAEAGLGGRVHFLGVIEDVPGLLGALDLAVFSSYAEGVPNAILEAMAAGLAVAATDYPGIREAVGDEGGTLLARERDAPDLADKILLAASDSTMRDRIGQAARVRVAREFSVQRMGRESVEVILQAWR